MQQISSQQNERLKATRRLQRSKGRRSRRDADRLLLEGPHLLSVALDRRIKPEFVLFADSTVSSFGDLIRRLEGASVPMAQVPDDWLEEAADADSPRGVLAVASVQELPFAEQFAELTESRALLLLDGVQDPGNVGALVRSAVGAGCEAVLATRGTCDWRHPRALRASAGASLACRLCWGLEPEQLGQLPHDRIGLSAHGGVEAWAAPWPDRSVLVVGSEAHGLQPAVRALVDEERTIPLAGGVESLNAAVAGALMLFARAQAEAPDGD